MMHGYLFSTVLLLVPILIMGRRWRLPFGVPALLVAVPAALMHLMFASDEGWWLALTVAGAAAGTEVVLRAAGRWVRWSADARWIVAGLIAPLLGVGRGAGGGHADGRGRLERAHRQRPAHPGRPHRRPDCPGHPPGAAGPGPAEPGVRGPGAGRRRLPDRCPRVVRVLRWFGFLLAVSTGLVLTGASPAAAHAGGLTATDARSRVVAVTPAVPGLGVTAIEDGARLRLRNGTPSAVTVPAGGGPATPAVVAPGKELTWIDARSTPDGRTVAAGRTQAWSWSWTSVVRR